MFMNFQNYTTTTKFNYKYKPKKEELGKYDNYIIENNENFVIINKPAGIQFSPVLSHLKILLIF